jgi:hypothetical protein
MAERRKGVLGPRRVDVIEQCRQPLDDRARHDIARSLFPADPVLE